ncbi:hypothetical protein [Pseudomonas sp. P1.8]|uniref:hypothetical protein n=1 Tax=Pseudomonas sp. P1.8 TaxID=1699310 RepID=UPI000AF1172B|nr:hypothetical protein [Pseudomonas sp. P1.8]
MKGTLQVPRSDRPASATLQSILQRLEANLRVNNAGVGRTSKVVRTGAGDIGVLQWRRAAQTPRFIIG